MLKSLVSLCFVLPLSQPACGITSPYGWDLRKSLAGLWNFKTSPLDDVDLGFKEKWWTHKFTGDVSQMPVPSSFNDVSTDGNIRDYVGWVWYQTAEPVDLSDWEDYRKVISFGGVHYNSVVWFGEHLVGNHEGGHIPFEFELPEVGSGFVTVAVNNTLTNHTIPQGSVTHHQGLPGYPPYRSYRHDFDYFDYAGINRNVFLYATSKDAFIKDLIIHTFTNLSQQLGFVEFNVIPGYSYGLSNQNLSCIVRLRDDKTDYISTNCNDTIVVKDPMLWWNIFSEHGSPAYLYSLVVQINTSDSLFGGNTYRTKVGIRSISWNNYTLFLNEKPLYLKGFGKHEDSEIRGRGFDWVVTMRDFELLKWTHANVIRTTHYPPSIELVDIANQRGLLLIVESPACSLSHFDSEILQLHKTIMKEMFSAYGPSPSVIMWSLANEPISRIPEADIYFDELGTLMRSLDKRPVTFVTAAQPSNDKGAKYVDVICINRYNAWYSYPGHLDMIDRALTKEISEWKSTFNVPVVITEYGAGSLSGLHDLPSSMWSEDYQTDLLKAHFTVFDKLKARGLLSGEMMWVFADFATPQEYIRPGACVKGIFTRQRQPKKAAYTVRERYKDLACPVLEGLYGKENSSQPSGKEEVILL